MNHSLFKEDHLAKHKRVEIHSFSYNKNIFNLIKKPVVYASIIVRYSIVWTVSKSLYNYKLITFLEESCWWNVPHSLWEHIRFIYLFIIVVMNVDYWWTVPCCSSVMNRISLYFHWKYIRSNCLIYFLSLFFPLHL